MPHELTLDQQNCHFEMSSSLIVRNNELFLCWIVTHNNEWIFYSNRQLPTQWLNWEEAPKHFPKPKRVPKKDHGHCLVVCCWSDPLQLSESQQNYCIWEVCSANWWYVLKTTVPTAGIGQQKGPNSSPQQHPTVCRTTNNTLKVEWIGLQSYASSAIFTWPLANHLPLLQAIQLLEGRMLPQPAGGRKCFPRVHQILKHGVLYYGEKQTYFSLAKMCWLYGFYFD